jgi:hypothetical protein
MSGSDLFVEFCEADVELMFCLHDSVINTSQTIWNVCENKIMW